KATVKDLTGGQPVSGATVTFTITTSSPAGTLSAFAITGIDGVAQVTIPLTLTAGSVATLAVTYVTNNPTLVASLVGSQNFPITQDPNVGPGINASTVYTGSRFFWTTGPTSSTATLTLTATIRNGA